MNRLLVVIFVAASLAAGCSDKPSEDRRGGPQAFPVMVEEVRTRVVEYAVSAIGSVEAFEEVSVVARVAGVVEHVSFMEGDRVKAGEALATIDPERFRANRQIALAQVKHTEALKEEATRAYERRRQVAEQNPALVRDEELQSYRTQAAAAEAQWMKARAELDIAELNLRDAHARSPVSGVVQQRLVHTGQYVQPGAPVAKLVREDPLLLRFEAAGSDAARIREDSAIYFLSDGREYQASILHIAASANVNRMVPILAKVGGDTARLRPGSFAEVRVVTSGAEDAVVIPQIAVRPSEKGLIVFVADDGVARQRTIRAGMRTADGMLEVVEGLAPGEHLIIRGSDALRDGAPISVVGANEAAPRGLSAPTTDAAGAAR